MLALPSANLINVFGPAEVFDEVNAHLSRSVYRVRIVSAGLQGKAEEMRGRHLSATELSEFAPTAESTVLLAGGLSWPLSLPQQQMSELTNWVRSCCRQARRFCGISSGSLLLAEAGLLHKKQATTHWACIQHMNRRYPNVKILPDHIYVKDGGCYTAAGGTSAIDLALSLVEEDLGTDTAVDVAKRLVMFLRRTGTQSQLSTTLLAQTSPAASISNLLIWMADNLDQNLSVANLARRVAMSPRNFARHFLSEVGKTPGRHVRDLRLEAALRNLAHGNLGLGEVARASGLSSVEAFRRLFIKSFGTPPGRYRLHLQKGAEPIFNHAPRQTDSRSLIDRAATL